MATRMKKTEQALRDRGGDGAGAVGPAGPTAPALDRLMGDGRFDLSDELVDELLEGYDPGRPQDITGPDGLLAQLTRRVVERAMHAELDEHLGYPKHSPLGRGSGNSRNGTTPKTLITDHGRVAIERPRDRAGTFEPQIVPNGDTRFAGFDDKILSLYANGMTVRDIRRHLREIYHVEVSPDTISRVTDAVAEDVKAWQNRPLESVYAIVYLDAISVKITDAGAVRRKAIYIASGVTLDGERETLGMWIQKTEGAKFWMHVLTELRNRGVQDILIACVDGLNGFPDAIEAIFKKTIVQTCIVHLIRNSLAYVSYKDRRAAAADLKTIYTAANADAAEQALDAFEDTWNAQYPSIAKAWRSAWEHVIPFLAYPPQLRRVIYTTNAIEALNRQIRKAIKTRGHFPTDDAALKLIWMTITRQDTGLRRVRDWPQIRQALEILFEDRLPTNH